jgi:SAM-dependent methyltransferase
MRRALAKALIGTTRSLGYHVTAVRKKKLVVRSGVNLNIGAGNNVIEGFRSLDIYTPHYYRSREAFDATRVEYDMRRDAIPVASGSVDNIYVNHVIEHVETEHVERFFAEAHRVLRPGGVLRVGCPDADFVHRVSSFENGYWNWRRNWFARNTTREPDQISQFDAMIGMLATRRMRGYNHAVASLEIGEEDVKGMQYSEFLERLRDGLVFDETHPEEHINSWDFARLRNLASSIGFTHVVSSKPRGSISAQMQGPAFDSNHNHMSLYVDIVR